VAGAPISLLYPSSLFFKQWSFAQTHYGLWTEWALVTGNVHPVNMRCRHFWLAIVVVRSVCFLLSISLSGYTPPILYQISYLPFSLSLPFPGNCTHPRYQIIASLYALGLLLLPRQFRQEANARRTKNTDVGQKNTPESLI
jgi:hypothetical protein